jgi:hypothetical protein
MFGSEAFGGTGFGQALSGNSGNTVNSGGGPLGGYNQLPYNAPYFHTTTVAITPASIPSDAAVSAATVAQVIAPASIDGTAQLGQVSVARVISPNGNTTWSFLQSKQAAGSGTTLTITPNVPFAAGSRVVLNIKALSGLTSLTVSDGSGNTYQLAAGPYTSGFTNYAYTAVLASAAASLTMNWTNSTSVRATADEFTGPGLGFDKFATAHGAAVASPATTGVSLSPFNDNELIVAGVHPAGATNMVPGIGYQAGTLNNSGSTVYRLGGTQSETAPMIVTNSGTVTYDEVATAYSAPAGGISPAQTIGNPTVAAVTVVVPVGVASAQAAGNITLSNYLPISTLWDDFNDNAINSSLWSSYTNGATLAEQNQRLEIALTFGSSGYSAYQSQNYYSLFGSVVMVEVPQVVNNVAGAETVFRLGANDGTNNNFLDFVVSDNLYTRAIISGSSFVGTTTYSAVNHRWWRFREVAGTVYWDASPDGQSWTNLDSRALSTFPAGTWNNGANLQLMSGQWQVAASAPGTTIFDNVNVVRLAPVAINSDSGVGLPAVSVPAANIAPTGIPAAQSSGAVSVTYAYAVNTVGIVSAERAGVTTVSTQANLLPAGITSGGALGVPTVSASVVVAAASIVSSERSGAVSVASAVSVSPAGVRTTEAVGAASIAVGLSLMQSIQDDFEFGGVDDGKWSTWGAVGVAATSNLLLELTSTGSGNYGGLLSLAQYDLRGSYAMSRLVDAGSQATGLEVYPLELVNGSDAVAIMVSGGVVYARNKISGSYSTVGSTVTYNSTTMQWFRIRESSGTTYWEYAANPASTWTLIASASNPINVSTLSAGITLGTWTSVAVTTAKVDNFNLLPAANQFTWKGYTWNGRIHQGSPTNNQAWASNISGPDINDYLTLSLANPTGNQPYGSEFFSAQRGFGYGTYLAVIGTRLDTMDPKVGFGNLFLFDFTAPPDYREIDVAEIRNYNGNPNIRLLHSHVYNNAGTRQFITDDVDVSADIVVTHRLIWEPGRLTFDAFVGTGVGGTNYFHTVHTTNIPAPGLERVHFNIWNNTGVAGYLSATPTDVVLRDFSFTPGTAVFPAGIVSSEGAGSPAISTAVTLAPVSVASAQRMGSTVVSAGLSTLTPASINDTSAPGFPVVSVGAAVVAPAGIGDASRMGSVTISASVNVAPVGFNDATNMGATAISATVNILPAAITPGAGVGAPVISQPSTQSVTVSGLPSGQAMGGAVVALAGLPAFVTSSSVASTSIVGVVYVALGAPRAERTDPWVSRGSGPASPWVAETVGAAAFVAESESSGGFSDEDIGT